MADSEVIDSEIEKSSDIIHEDEEENSVRIEVESNGIYRVPLMWLTHDADVDVYLELK